MLTAVWGSSGEPASKSVLQLLRARPSKANAPADAPTQYVAGLLCYVDGPAVAHVAVWAGKALPHVAYSGGQPALAGQRAKLRVNDQRGPMAGSALKARGWQCWLIAVAVLVGSGCGGGGIAEKAPAPPPSPAVVPAGTTARDDIPSPAPADSPVDAPPPLDSPTLADSSARRFIAISAGSARSCGIEADRVAVYWGGNEYGGASAPAGLRFTAISAGWAHSCGIDSEGVAVRWGANDFGQSRAPAGRFSAISAG